MASTFDTSILDDLIPSVVDPLRSDLYPLTGIRAYTVAIIRRRWSGSRRGQGTPTVLTTVTLDPQPKVTFESMQQSLRFDMQATGRQEEGEVTLTEVSLQLQEADLTGDPIAITDEFYYKITDAHGQGSKARYYVIKAPPQIDRDKDIGWRIQLRRAEVEE